MRVLLILVLICADVLPVADVVYIAIFYGRNTTKSIWLYSCLSCFLNEELPKLILNDGRSETQPITPWLAKWLLLCWSFNALILLLYHSANGGVIVLKKNHKDPWVKKIVALRRPACTDNISCVFMHGIFSIWSVQLPSVTIRQPFPSSHQISFLHFFITVFNVLGSRFSVVLFDVDYSHHKSRHAISTKKSMRPKCSCRQDGQHDLLHQ